jgi:hypothetical protein
MTAKQFHVGQVVRWKLRPREIWEVFKVTDLVIGIRLDWGAGRYETHFVSYDECTLIQ